MYIDVEIVPERGYLLWRVLAAPPLGWSSGTPPAMTRWRSPHGGPRTAPLPRHTCSLRDCGKFKKKIEKKFTLKKKIVLKSFEAYAKEILTSALFEGSVDRYPGSPKSSEA